MIARYLWNYKKGISEKSTINEIMVTYGEPTDKDISEDFSYYKYGDIFESVEFHLMGID